jgi:hypothetical protein
MTTASPSRRRPSGDRSVQRRPSRWWIGGLVVSLIVVGLASALASPDPDGLERVAEDQGFLERARDSLYSLLPDYTIPGLDGALSTMVSGAIGVALVFVTMIVVGRLLARRKRAR